MLNRIKKNLITTLIACTLCVCQCSCFALDSTVSFVSINDRAYRDVEIVIDKNKIYVPFKQLADLFNIPYQANRVDKKISFTTWDGKEGMVTQAGVFVEDRPITKKAPIFIMQGIMDGVFNEAYIEAGVIEQVMGVSLDANFEDLALYAKVERDIPILANAEQIDDENTPKAYQDVVVPKKQGKITLKTIGLRSNMQSDNMSTKPLNDRTYINDTFTGSTQLSINGDFMNGQYRIEATEYNYRNKPFMFGGVTATYRNHFTYKDYKNLKNPNASKRKYYYELGKVGGIIDDDAALGINLFGAQIWDYDNKRKRPDQLCGYVKPTSLVRLTVNDLEPVTLSTYAGYYSLKHVQLPNPVKRVKLEEINEDGTVELICDEKYSIFGNETPFEKESRVTAYAGVWGYQDRLFREGQNVYRGQNKKVTGGAEYQYGIKDNVTAKAKVTADKIYEKTNSKIIYKIPTNDALLVSGTQKSVNYLEGATSLNSVEWKSDDKRFKARATAGANIVHDTREHDTHAGYMGKLTGEYNQELDKYKFWIFKPHRLRAKLEGFHTSPDWYVASTDSTSKNDRTGGRVSGGLSFNNTNLGGNYSKYVSNINHRYKGGKIVFDEVGINAATTIPKVAELRFDSYYRQGKNDFGRNKNYNFDANIRRTLWAGSHIQAGDRKNVYDTKYHQETADDRNYYSNYNDVYIEWDTPLPKNMGKFRFGHDFIRYKSGSYKNGYNMFKFGYIFPTWKRLTFGVGWGFKYSGQCGHDLGASIAYRAKSGQTASVSYQWSQNGGYFVDNMFMPTTNRHSVNFNFNDAFQIFHHGLKSVGDEDLNKGIFEAIAFVDVDGDGKFTKKVDVPIKDVSLKTSWSGGENVTNKRGRVYSTSLDEGVYTVSINMDDLPITVAPVSNDLISRKVKIYGGRTTILEIPLVSTVGSVSGTLKIADDFDRGFNITDFVVVLLNENGEEVNYSTVGENGDFYISGLAPGKYTLQLDERFINAYGLEEGDKSRIDIVIPFDYNTPFDVMDQELEYKAMAL